MEASEKTLKNKWIEEIKDKYEKGTEEEKLEIWNGMYHFVEKAGSLIQLVSNDFLSKDGYDFSVYEEQLKKNFINISDYYLVIDDLQIAIEDENKELILEFFKKLYEELILKISNRFEEKFPEFSELVKLF